MSAARYELRRALGLRSTWTVLVVVLAAGAVGSAALAAFVAFGPVPASGYTGADVARLVVTGVPALPLGAGVLGAALGGMDHRHKLLELSLLLTPRRGRLLAGKVATVALLAGTLAVAGLALAVALVLAFGLPAAGVTPALVVGQVVRVVAWGVTGLLLGVATRSPAVAGTVLLVAALLVEPVLRTAARALPGAWWTALPAYLPCAALDGLVPRAAAGAVFADTAGASVGGSVVAATVYLGVLTVAAWRSLAGAPVRRAGAAIA